jgi:flagellar biosynthesis regulator FlbT
MKIPTWEEAKLAITQEYATPIDVFVYDFEPAGKEAEKMFRERLKEMLAYVSHDVVNA